MVIAAYVMLGIAVVWFLYKLSVSYRSAGGTDQMVSVYDAATYPPILLAVGLYFVLPSYDINWPILAFVGIWLGATLVAALSIRMVEELGDRPLR